MKSTQMDAKKHVKPLSREKAGTTKETIDVKSNGNDAKSTNQSAGVFAGFGLPSRNWALCVLMTGLVLYGCVGSASAQDHSPMSEKLGMQIHAKFLELEQRLDNLTNPRDSPLYAMSPSLCGPTIGTDLRAAGWTLAITLLVEGAKLFVWCVWTSKKEERRRKREHSGKERVDAVIDM